MPTRENNRFVVILVVLLAAVSIVVIVFATSRSPRVEGTSMASLQVPTVPAQGTASPTQALPGATMSPPASPTLPPDETPHPTIQLVQLPSVVAEGTYIPLGPTPNATEVADTAHREYLLDVLYKQPATPVAEGVNTTPIPSEVYSGVSLTTYEISKVSLPQEEAWETILPTEDNGFAPSQITFREAWRVTVRGSGFIFGNNIATMYADDTLIGVVNFDLDRGGMTTIVYDRSLLQNGSKLGLSFGGGVTYVQEPIDLPPTP